MALHEASMKSIALELGLEVVAAFAGLAVYNIDSAASKRMRGFAILSGSKEKKRFSFGGLKNRQGHD